MFAMGIFATLRGQFNLLNSTWGWLQKNYLGNTG